MSIFSHSVTNFPFDRLYKAVQTALKGELADTIKRSHLGATEDKVFEEVLKAIKKFNEPAIKKLVERFVKEQPTYKMDALIKGTSFFVRILDTHNKEVEKTETFLIKDPKTLIKATVQLMAEKNATKAVAAQVVKARQIKPIPVLHKDFAADVMHKAGTKGQFKIDDLKINIVLKNPTILQHVPNEVSDALLAHKLHDAADQDEICKELTEAYVKISRELASPAEEKSAQAQLKIASEAVSKRAKARAAKVITDLLKMNIDQNQFNADIQVSLGVAIGGTVLGATATAVSIVTAPLHLGVATAASAIATAQSLKSTVHLIMDSCKNLETVSKELKAARENLQAQYKNASRTDVGLAEMGKTLANSLIPNFQDSISRIKGLVEQVEGGLRNREVEIHKVSAQLSDLVAKGSKAEKQLAQFEKANEKGLTAKQKEGIKKAEKAVATIAPEVDRMFRQVKDSFQGLTELKKEYATMRDGVAKLASGKPTWAEVGEVLIGTATAAGFLVGGNIASPDPYKGMEAFNMMAGLVGNVQGSIDLTLNLSKGLEESLHH